MVADVAVVRTQLNDYKEVVVPGLEQSLHDARTQLNQAQTKLEKYLHNEVRSARNRAANATLVGGQCL